jgi:hypothetical protein
MLFLQSPKDRKELLMKRGTILITIIAALLIGSVVQASVVQRVWVPGYGYRYYEAGPRMSYGGYSSYGRYGRYGSYGRYGCRNEALAIGVNAGMGVLGMLLEDKQNDRAMNIAEREQDARIAAAEAVKKEAERQQMFELANRLKAQQAEQEARQKRAENEKLRQEIAQLQLELQKERLQKEIEKEKQK